MSATNVAARGQTGKYLCRQQCVLAKAFRDMGKKVLNAQKPAFDEVHDNLQLGMTADDIWFDKLMKGRHKQK